MKVYLVHSGDINKHGHQDFDLIGVYQDKDMAIQAIKQTTLSSNMLWIVTVGYIEVRELQ